MRIMILVGECPFLPDPRKRKQNGKRKRKATETGGRCNATVTKLIDKLASYRAESAPRVLRRSVFLAWH